MFGVTLLDRSRRPLVVTPAASFIRSSAVMYCVAERNSRRLLEL
jgi:hypothetical protein